MVFRFIASAVLLTLVAVAAAAQPATGFDGRLVFERTGDPVAGASVSVVGSAGTARTDPNGRFTWAPAPQPPFQLIVVLSGGQVARPVIVDAVHPGTTTIEVAALADESVTVLGAAPSVDTAPASANTVLSALQIAQRSPENLMQALETVAGISQVSEGHASVPAVRGLARGRTLFLIDGARVTAERRIGPSATFLDPSIVEGIDIARGPGSVAYGSDAIGGVISVRTRRAELNTPLRTRVAASIGAGVPEQRGSIEMSKGFATGGVLVQAHVRNAEDYASPDGTVFNSGWEDRGVLLNVTRAGARGFLTAGWQSDFGRDVERPRNNSTSVRFFYPFENSHRFTASYELPGAAGFHQIAFTGFLGAYDQRTDQDRFPTAARARSVERADISANDFHVKGSAERAMGRGRVEFGVDVNGRFNLAARDIAQAFDRAGALASETVTVSIDAARRVDTGVYVQAEAALAAFARLAGGARIDRVTTANIGGFFGDRTTSNTSPSGLAALTLGPFARFSATVQVSRGFRDPVLSDRYFRGPSGRGFITGNPDLASERSIQFDLSTRYAVGQTQIGLYFYRYRIDDLVERYQTETDVFFFRNRGRALLRGVEVEARSELGRGYAIDLAAQIARGRALDDDAPLDDIAPATVSVGARKAFTERVYAQARAAWSADDDRPGPSEVAAPGATIVDVSGGWQILPQLELRGVVRNLFDESYYASPDPRWVPAPGRSSTLTAVLQF